PRQPTRVGGGQRRTRPAGDEERCGQRGLWTESARAQAPAGLPRTPQETGREPAAAAAAWATTRRRPSPGRQPTALSGAGSVGSGTEDLARQWRVTPSPRRWPEVPPIATPPTPTARRAPAVVRCPGLWRSAAGPGRHRTPRPTPPPIHPHAGRGVRCRP